MFAGGPGSQKGLVIDELRRRYDFITISTDDIVFNYLPNKMANMVEMPSDIITQLKVYFYHFPLIISLLFRKIQDLCR